MKHDDRVRLVVEEAVEPVERPDRLCAGGEIVRGIVLLSVLELPRQRADRHQHHKPHPDHGVLRAPAPEQPGE